MSSTNDSILANMQKGTETLISGFDTGNIDKIMANRSKDCTQLILPKTLGRTPKNNKEARKHVTHVYNILHNWTFVADNILYDVPSKKSSFHATSSATSAVGPFGNEYAFFLWFDEAGKEITGIEELVDSGYTSRFFEQLSAHMKSTGGSSEHAENVMTRD